MLREEIQENEPRNSQTITPDSESNDVAKVSHQKIAIKEKLPNKMFSYARKIIRFFLAIIFTALAALHSSSPKVSKPPLPKPFFSQNSLVLDFYEGHLTAMVERITHADFSFVMYYAPWDAESQAVREEFEKVARYYHSQIFFAAINCWHPNSQCRTEYNKIQSYPVLVLYPSVDSAIMYSGIRTWPYMIRFLYKVMNPIFRITQKEQLADLLENYDAVVIAFFNFIRLDQAPGYNEFYKAAMRSLEGEQNGDLVFAVVTNAFTSKREFNVSQFPSASIFTWNKSLRYPENYVWSSENILHWISSSMNQPVLWLQPPGIKAVTLAPYLRGGPVLFLFTPRNPLHQQNYNYNLIREIGLQYYNCANNVLTMDIIEHLRLKRRKTITEHRERTQFCASLLKETKDDAAESTMSISIQRWINDTCCDNIATNKCSPCAKNILCGMDRETFTRKLVPNKFDQVCRTEDIFRSSTLQNSQRRYETCCNQESFKFGRQKYKPSSSMTIMEDLRSPAAIKQAHQRLECKKWIMGNKYYQPVFPQEDSQHIDTNLTESACKINKTLSFIAIDSLHYFHFMESLGIGLSKKKDKTAVIILDVANESQYVMHQDFNRQALVQFINNYTHGFLQRTLRSNSLQRFVQKFKTEVKCNVTDVRSVCIEELTTETFLHTVLNPSKDVVVMYYSPYCAFCSAIFYTYLTVAHYLRDMHHLIFVRVDGDNNDLPWEYNMNRFPSILFFPSKRKEDSTIYPFSLPITIPNLVNFILTNLDKDSHVEALVNICQSGAGEAPDLCISRTRWLCLDIIEQLLRSYRKLLRPCSSMGITRVKGKRKIILLKLAHVRDIHLILVSTLDLREDQAKVKLIRERYNKYYASLKSLELDSK